MRSQGTDTTIPFLQTKAARQVPLHVRGLSLALLLLVACHAMAQAEAGQTTPTAVCTTKTGWASSRGIYPGPAIFSIDNPCTGSTLHLMIQVDESSQAFRVCNPASLEFVQRGRQFWPQAWVYTNEYWEPYTPLEWVSNIYCVMDGERLLPGTIVYTLVSVDPQAGLDFREPFSVFFDSQRVVDFP
jgi:hypothetical protein